MTDHTPYQKKVIRRYYERRDEIQINRLSELVTSLQLAETDKERSRLWKRVAASLRGAGVAPPEIHRVVEGGDLERLARLVRTLLGTK